ncbi:diacylglycerol/lipid kinase family protein [Chelatococcus reniformis]|uniref:Diacylglycerol kinase n=1 Tax=Chelatococcus reniformis TaxID=1494448 RepID=A0A916U0F4_9HYPH|nr:diacylglycerol kinase family protein [Chelatococcus reniformis]GGC55651.1 diacylglycerol kinase [Chelatococcus reniformis]
MRRHVAVVINKSSGSLIGTPLADRIAQHLAEAGVDATLVPDDRPLPARVEAALAVGADAVVVGGGDGTIACAAQLLYGRDVALGIIPLGTMNLLAKDLGIPLDPATACRALADGGVRQIDVGTVNGHVFLCNSVLGIPSRLARLRERERGRMGPAAYWRLAVAGARAFGRYPSLRIAIDMGDGPRRVRTWALAVASNDYDEGVGQIMSRSKLDDGELAVYVTGPFGIWRIMRLALGMAIGNWRKTPGLERYRTAGLSVHSRRSSLRLMNDGEILRLPPPLEYRIRQRALSVIVPRAAPGPALRSGAGAAAAPAAR